MRILVTAGATREPIDAVRYLSNIGTGTTGALMADALGQRGHRVTLLSGEGAARPRETADVEGFTSAEDLRKRLERRLGAGGYDAVIMTAAVADYRPEEVLSGKLGSEAEFLALRLVRNRKLLPNLKSYAGGRLVVAGFKLTVAAEGPARRAAVEQQFAAGGVDFVVHNDLEDTRRAAVHPFWIYHAPDAPPKRVEGAAALALALEGEFLRALGKG